MILIDSNVPMYLVGASHPHKQDAHAVLQRLVNEEHRLVTDTEVFQEILHRYASIGRREAIGPAFSALLGLVDEVLDVTLAVVQQARDLVLGDFELSARDALHVAVMHQHDIRRIVSFDQDFDRVPGIERLYR